MSSLLSLVRELHLILDPFRCTLIDSWQMSLGMIKKGCLYARKTLERAEPQVFLFFVKTNKVTVTQRDEEHSDIYAHSAVVMVCRFTVALMMNHYEGGDTV